LEFAANRLSFQSETIALGLKLQIPRANSDESRAGRPEKLQAPMTKSVKWRLVLGSLEVGAWFFSSPHP
jgi:hypothetical protein